MGLTYIPGTVVGPTGETADHEFLVDSGARYTLVPFGTWQRLGLQPAREERFVLADGTIVTRRVAYCPIRLPQGEAPTPVILGEPGDEPLLGVVTLEILGLVLNPFTRTLQPMRLMLA